MRIVCTFGQFTSMRHWGTDRHREYLDRAVTVGKRRSVAMPYAGWSALADLLREEAFTKWGKGRPSKLVDDAKGTRSALHLIERHLTALAAHPALRGKVVLGSSMQTMTAWERYPLYEVWSLIPVSQSPMKVLYPVLDGPMRTLGEHSVSMGDVTRWYPRDWDEGCRRWDLFPEVEHLNWGA